ncbi:hypothetical protein ACB092_05G148600 [Castanea dentata]
MLEWEDLVRRYYDSRSRLPSTILRRISILTTLVTKRVILLGGFRLLIGTTFFLSHKSARYHAQKLCSSNRWATSKKELYNYRHLFLRTVIKKSFAILKACLPILKLMQIQAN